MPLEFYKVLHVLGMVMVASGLAGVLVHTANGGTRQSNKMRITLALTHGLGLVIVLVSGFGMLQVAGLTWAGWTYGKIAIWLWLGAALGLAMRKPKMATKVWYAMLAAVAIAAYLALYKPF